MGPDQVISAWELVQVRKSSEPSTPAAAHVPKTDLFDYIQLMTECKRAVQEPDSSADPVRWLHLEKRVQSTMT